MLTVYMALINILINGPNRIEFPVPPFNSIFLCCSAQTLAVYMTRRGLHGVFRCKIQVQNCFLEH